MKAPVGAHLAADLTTPLPGRLFQVRSHPGRRDSLRRRPFGIFSVDKPVFKTKALNPPSPH